MAAMQGHHGPGPRRLAPPPVQPGPPPRTQVGALAIQWKGNMIIIMVMSLFKNNYYGYASLLPPPGCMTPAAELPAAVVEAPECPALPTPGLSTRVGGIGTCHTTASGLLTTGHAGQKSKGETTMAMGTKT